jgi:hypothetical protein
MVITERELFGIPMLGMFCAGIIYRILQFFSKTLHAR